MIGPPRIEQPVKRLLVVEIAVAAIDWQLGRGEARQDRARRALDDFVALSRDDHDHLMPEASRRFQLGFDISPDTAALGRVKSTDIDDPHAGPKAGIGR